MKTFEGFFTSEKKRNENLINKLHRYILLMKGDFVEKNLVKIKNGWIYKDSKNRIRIHFGKDFSGGITLDILKEGQFPEIYHPVEKYSIYKNKFYFGYIDPKRLVPDKTVYDSIKDFFEDKISEPMPIPSKYPKNFD